jgi:hypothetical protein
MMVVFIERLVGMNIKFVTRALLVAGLMVSLHANAWSTRKGWPGLPSQLGDRIQVALARGSAAEPSAVFPLTEPGTPVECWWDDKALHVGGNVYQFAKLGIEPKDGASFTVKVPISEGWAYHQGLRELKLDVVLDEDAAVFRVPDFGVLGNRSLDLPVYITPKRDGQVRVFSNAVGARSPRFIRDKIIKAKAGQTVEARIHGPAPDSGNHIFDVYDADGTVVFMAFYPFHDPAVKFAYRTVISDPAKMLLLMRVDQWLDKGDEYELTIRMNDLDSGEPTGVTSSKRLDQKWGVLDIPFDVSSLRPGVFKMLYDVKDLKTGRVIHSDYAYYAKPDGKCVWDDTTYGSEDTVPMPWTTPKFGAAGFSVWNRSVKFGRKRLLSSVVSAGQEL